MKRREFEEKIKELSLDKIYYQGRVQEYSRNLYEDNKKNNIYGCYFNGTDYIIFFKDFERNVTKELGHYKTEDEAYDKLFEKIITLAE